MATTFWIVARGVDATGILRETQEQCSTANAGRKAISTWMEWQGIAVASVEVQSMDGRVLTEWSQTLPAARGARRAA